MTPSITEVAALRKRYGGLRAAMILHPSATRAVGTDPAAALAGGGIIDSHVAALTPHAPRLAKESW